MGMTVELREKPRVFEVWIGENSIGEVTSYIDDDDDMEDAYKADLYRTGDESENLELGWYSTLRIAAQQIIDYAHGNGKIDAITKSKV